MKNSTRIIIAIISCFVFTNAFSHKWNISDSIQMYRFEIESILRRGEVPDVQINMKIGRLYVFTPREQECFALLKMDYPLFFDLYRKHQPYTRRLPFQRITDIDVDSELANQYFEPLSRIFQESLFELQRAILVNNKEEILRHARFAEFPEHQVDFIELYIRNFEFLIDRATNTDTQIELLLHAQDYLNKHRNTEFEGDLAKIYGTYTEPKSIGLGYTFNGNYISWSNHFQQKFVDNHSIKVEVHLFCDQFFIGFGFTATDMNPKIEPYLFGDWLVRHNFYSIMIFSNWFVGRDFDFYRNRFSLRPKIGLTRLHFGSELREDNALDGAPTSLYVRKHNTQYYGLDFLVHVEKNSIKSKRYFSVNKRPLRHATAFFKLGLDFMPSAMNKFDASIFGDVVIYNIGFGLKLHGTRKVPVNRLMEKLNRD